MQLRCPFCLSEDTRELLHVREMAKGTRDVFDYALCGSCGSPYIAAFPNDIARYYQGYYSFDDGQLPIEKSWLKLALVGIYSRMIVRRELSFAVRSCFRSPSPRQMRFLSPNLQAFLYLGANSRARILDVGCGSGQFVRMMQLFGYSRATGVDPYVEITPGRAYVNRADIHTVSEGYDLILFNHSFEHLTDPEVTLHRCGTILSEGGTVLIHVPNPESREFSKYQEHWWGLHAPYHYAIPSRRGLESLAKRCGFRITDSICTSRADHYLYSDEYSRDISDTDPLSSRREFESETFDRRRLLSLSRLACALNNEMSGDWICYYLERA